MKKILLLAALVFATLQLTAANVDLATAQQYAQRFLMSQTVQGRFMTSAPSVKWTHEVKNSSNAAQAAFYIVNTDKGYVIVAGDDRAREVLAWGEGSIENMNDLPEAMQLFLRKYQKQMEYLQAHPGLMVQKRVSRGGISVDPMLTTAWSQDKPYNMKCPKIDSRTYCKVGCSAVALAQVMNYWRFPESSPALPGYTGEEFGITVQDLPPYTFDWDNLLSWYNPSNIDNYSDVIMNAIGYLMRYTGQAMNMDYGKDRSGAEHDDIMQAIRTFGFDTGAHFEMKDDYDTGETNYTDEQWAALIQSELVAGRPLVYCAFDMQSDSAAVGGHAFNIDGYDADNDTYHVNFGMAREKNDWYALDAFTLDNGMTVYDFFPLLFAGLQPPTGPAVPRMIVSPTTLNMECYAGETTTAVFNVAGVDLTDAITVTVNDANGVFTTDVASIAVADAANKTVTVTYAPQAVGEHTATITLSTPGGVDVTVSLNGVATAAPLVKYDPVMLPANEDYITLTSFRADWTDQTSAQNVVSYTLEVNTKPNYTILAEADWTNTVEVFPNQASSWASSGLIPEGWSFSGSGLWAENKFISFQNATITLPEFTGYDKVTVVFTGRGAYGSANVTVATSQASQAYALGNGVVEQYVVVLNCAETDRVTFTANSGYVGLLKVAVYSGEIEPPTMRATETGDATHRTITGITDKFYTVTGLTEAGTFLYKVKALYTDGTESAWSNTEEVTLFDNGPAPHGFAPGDVNHDEKLSIKDVTDLINYLLSGDESAICTICANVNGDDKVNITDVTALINILLSSD